MKKLCEREKMYRSIVNRLMILVSNFTETKQTRLKLSTNLLKELRLEKEDLQTLRKKIEEEFDIKLPKGIFQEFQTLGEIVGFIETEIGR